jgi:hypothetical protein
MSTDHGSGQGSAAGVPASARSLDRRSFLQHVGVGAAAAATVASVSLPARAAEGEAASKVLAGGLAAANRRKQSYQYRVAAAKMAQQRQLVDHVNNGDEALYPNKIGSYTKALPHNELGEVDLAAYATLARAVQTQQPADFELIALGGDAKLTSPQAGLAMDLEGADSHHTVLPPAPRLDSAEAAGEMVELYWMALARDVNFSDYATSPVVAAAVEELSNLSDFRGPKENGRVTPATLFRNSTPGDLTGPWISQFLTLDIPMGALHIEQKILSLAAGVDYMTRYEDWLAVQNGATPPAPALETTPRYMRSLRDLARWVHVDALYQSYLQAALVMIGQGTRVDPGLPLYDAHAQVGFAQCGGPHVLSLVAEVATRALKAVWYQKWFVHSRLRPEEYGGRVHNAKTGAASYPLHADVLGSAAVEAVFQNYGTYLLPMAYPEGSPTHPSYGSGHATVAGACVTALKAFFDETDTIKNPMVPNADGTALVPYEGPELTVLGELNKVASNIANARNGAGVHWRTDAVNSLRLGEEVAVCILQEQKLSYNDTVEMSLTRFDGTRITI